MATTPVSNLLVDDASRVFVATVQLAVGNMLNNAEGAKLANAFAALNYPVTVQKVAPDRGAHFDAINAIIYWEDKIYSPEMSKLEMVPRKANHFPSWVVLAHEIGHAIQFKTSGLLAADWFAKYLALQEIVEMDNIRRHESPIVKSLGLVARSSYTGLGEKNIKFLKANVNARFKNRLGPLLAAGNRARDPGPQ